MHGSAQMLSHASRRLAAFALLLALSVHGHTPAQAGDYPDHTVKIVVPTPGSLDSSEIMGITTSTNQTGATTGV